MNSSAFTHLLTYVLDNVVLLAPNPVSARSISSHHLLANAVY